MDYSPPSDPASAWNYHSSNGACDASLPRVVVSGGPRPPTRTPSFAPQSRKSNGRWIAASVRARLHLDGGVPLGGADRVGVRSRDAPSAIPAMARLAYVCGISRGERDALVGHRDPGLALEHANH